VWYVNPLRHSIWLDLTQRTFVAFVQCVVLFPFKALMCTLFDSHLQSQASRMSTSCSRLWLTPPSRTWWLTRSSERKGRMVTCTGNRSGLIACICNFLFQDALDPCDIFAVGFAGRKFRDGASERTVTVLLTYRVFVFDGYGAISSVVSQTDVIRYVYLCYNSCSICLHCVH